MRTRALLPWFLLLPLACGDDDAPAAGGGIDAGVAVPSADAGAPAPAAPIVTEADAAIADAVAPTLAITSPREGLAFAERRIEVTGTVADDRGVAHLAYVVDGAAPVPVPVVDGAFTFAFVPAPGKNQVVVTATDDAGNVTSARRAVYFGHRFSVGNSQGALLDGGKLFTWGRNELGQLGNGTLTGTWSADEGAPLPAMYERSAPGLVSVVTRQTFMIALAADGTVQTWGSNSAGQLGYATPADCGTDGSAPCGRAPATVPGITDAVAVAAGFEHALVLRRDGTVLAFGKNNYGQLGFPGGNTSTPTPVPGLAGIVALGAGSAHSAAVTAEGKVLVWGNDQYGQRGDGTSDTSVHATPAEVPGLADATSVASANYTMLVRRRDGSVVAWGQNQNGQVGNGTTATSLTPTPVLTKAPVDGAAGVPLAGVTSIAADGFVGLALDRDGKGYAWGLGGLGQLGQGYLASGERDLASRSVASPIWVDPAAAASFVLVELEVGAGGPAFTSEQELYGWGWSFQGSLGGGSALLNAWAYSAPRLVYPAP